MSLTWKLVNIEGGTDFDRGLMDIEFDDSGTLRTIENPPDILDQRIEKD